eukprot:6169541-Amphidinium_carterae.1
MSYLLDHRDALAFSINVEAWSPSQARELIRLPHRALLGWNTNINRLSHATSIPEEFGSFHLRVEVLPTEGTFQGFTVFADTVTHKAMWIQILDKLRRAGTIPDKGRLIVYMDDAVTAAILVALSSMSAREQREAAREMRSHPAAQMWSRFNLRTDIMKSLIGSQKIIFLNVRHFGRHTAPSDSKLLCKPMRNL